MPIALFTCRFPSISSTNLPVLRFAPSRDESPVFTLQAEQVCACLCVYYVGSKWIWFLAGLIPCFPYKGRCPASDTDNQVKFLQLSRRSLELSCFLVSGHSDSATFYHRQSEVSNLKLLSCSKSLEAHQSMSPGRQNNLSAASLGLMK